jgi:hypothetical protein
MKSEAESIHGGTHSLHFLKALVEEGMIVFTTCEARQIAEKSGIPEGYVTNLLMLMVRNGWLIRDLRLEMCKFIHLPLRPAWLHLQRSVIGPHFIITV